MQTNDLLSCYEIASGHHQRLVGYQPPKGPPARGEVLRSGVSPCILGRCGRVPSSVYMEHYHPQRPAGQREWSSGIAKYHHPQWPAGQREWSSVWVTAAIQNLTNTHDMQNNTSRVFGGLLDIRSHGVGSVAHTVVLRRLCV